VADSTVPDGEIGPAHCSYATGWNPTGLPHSAGIAVRRIDPYLQPTGSVMRTAGGSTCQLPDNGAGHAN
jgi:hypothetical protein